MTDRREFLRFGAGAAALAVAGCKSTDSASSKITDRLFAGLKPLPPVMPNAVLKRGALRPKSVCNYVDDCIWFLRDIARMRTKSIFDTPYLKGFKRIHDETGLKVQFNLFYRTDFFYGMDEFTLADMPATYRSEFQDNADWIRFGPHSLQEFPDNPWVSVSYGDMSRFLSILREQVARFAGENLFARCFMPHWVPVSKEGVRAVRDAGFPMMLGTLGNRLEYNGDPNTLPYGHAFRLLNRRRPETALYTRESTNLAISASICGYNHLTVEQSKVLAKENAYVYDPDTGMSFQTAWSLPMSCLNLQTLVGLPADFAAVNGDEFVCYGNHEQYFFGDYFAHQPDYMEKELVAARLFRENGYSFCFMEEMLGNGAR